MTELICIVCPKGCHLLVDEQSSYTVSGHSCPRGEAYGKEELLNPTRVVTSTVRLTGGRERRCPVKTDGAIPKKLVIEAVRQLDSIELKSPIRCGQVVISNILGTGAAFVATRDL